jgi:hypothetical protein
MLEFAFVLPIFLIGFFGLIDGARLVFLNSNLSQAAREAARTASVQVSWIGSGDPSCNTAGGATCPAGFDQFRDNVVAAVNRMITPFGPIPSGSVHIRCDAATPPTGAWTGQSCTTRTHGAIVTVRVVHTFGAVTPVVGQIVGNVTLSGATTMVIN